MLSLGVSVSLEVKAYQEYTISLRVSSVSLNWRGTEGRKLSFGDSGLQSWLLVAKGGGSLELGSSDLPWAKWIGYPCKGEAPEQVA